MSNKKEAKIRSAEESEKPIFVCKASELTTARELIQEAKQHGAKLEPNIQSGQGSYRISLLDYEEPGLVELRQALRNSTLLANGANRQNVSIPLQIFQVRETVFKTSAIFPFVVWMNSLGKVISKSSHTDPQEEPVVKKLLETGPTNRGWDNVVCWDLGSPEDTLDTNSRGFRRIQPETATFLFSDEIDTLKKTGQLLSFIHQDLYEEMFEAYLIGPAPGQSKQSLLKVRSYLFD